MRSVATIRVAALWLTLALGACGDEVAKGGFELPVDDVAAAGSAGVPLGAGGVAAAPATGGAAPVAGTGGIAGSPPVAGTGGIAGSPPAAGTGGVAGSDPVAGTGGAAPPPMGTTPLPCDVATVFQGACIGCHGPTLLMGAPMPLLSWEDLEAPSRTMPARKVRELIVERIGSPLRPMPPRPNPALSPDQVATITTWVDAGGPPGTDPGCLLP